MLRKRRPPTTPSSRVDLSESPAFTLELLNGTDRWRQRVTEHFGFAAGAHVRLTTSYEVDFPLDLIRPYADPARYGRVNALIPLGTRPKHQLLNVTLEGPRGSPAHLLYRSDIAAIQALYLESLIIDSNAPTVLARRFPTSYLEAVSVFTPGVARLGQHGSRGRVPAVHAYLHATIDWALAPTEAEVAQWLGHADQAREILLEALGEPADAFSSAENFVLALPHLEPSIRYPREASDSISSFVNGVREARAAGATGFLSALAEYGRRYELIVETEVPLLEPSTLSIAEDRPLNMGPGPRFNRKAPSSMWNNRGVGRWSRQQIALGDGRRAHVEARIDDPSVKLADVHLTALDRTEIGYPTEIEGARVTIETLSIYSSVPSRPYYAELWIRFVATRQVRLSFWLITFLNAGAFVAVLVMPQDEFYFERLAVLLVPSTFAAAVTLAREQTGLAARILRPWRLLLAVSMAATWGLGLIQTATLHPDQARGSRQVPVLTRDLPSK